MKKYFLCALSSLALVGCTEALEQEDAEIVSQAEALHGGGTQYASVYDFNLDRQFFSLATLSRTDQHTRLSVNTGGLEAGDAYTIWFCGWNNPSECEHGDPPAGDLCGSSDFEFMGGNPDADDFCVWSGAGAIANSYGRARFSSVTVPGHNEGENLFGTDYTNINGAEIHLVVRHHGDALEGADLRDQLTTFNGGCPPNECVDVLFAVFPSL